jgi:hypothetical protein
VAKLRERLAVSKETTHRVRMERFNLKKVNYIKGKEQYRIEISNRFAALENSDADVDINTAWKTAREYQKFGEGESMLLRIEEA